MRLDCVVDDILVNLIDIHRHDEDVLFSSKVLQLYQRIRSDTIRNYLGRCIVFVERIFTANFLSQLLLLIDKRHHSEPTSHLKIEYLTGARASIGDVDMTAKHQVRYG
jgi:hypothetical protein